MRTNIFLGCEILRKETLYIYWALTSLHYRLMHYSGYRKFIFFYASPWVHTKLAKLFLLVILQCTLYSLWRKNDPAPLKKNITTSHENKQIRQRLHAKAPSHKLARVQGTRQKRVRGETPYVCRWDFFFYRPFPPFLYPLPRAGILSCHTWFDT
jgi:hypothetical protein